MIVKALSVWEPWASSMRGSNGRPYKLIETRSWATSYRGPLLICAAKLWTRAMREESSALCTELNLDLVPRPGMAVALVDLVSVESTQSLTTMRDGNRQFRAFPGMREHDLGDYTPGRFGWCTVPICLDFEPFPVRGAQGLFEVHLPPEVETRVREVQP